MSTSPLYGLLNLCDGNLVLCRFYIDGEMVHINVVYLSLACCRRLLMPSSLIVCVLMLFRYTVYCTVCYCISWLEFLVKPLMPMCNLFPVLRCS